MSNFYGLFLVVKDILKSIDTANTYSKITYGDMKDDEENAIGIYVTGGIRRNRDLSTGAYRRESDIVRIIVNSGREANSIIKAEEFCNEIRELLPTINNKTYDLDINKIGYNINGKLKVRDTRNEVLNQAEITIVRTDPQSSLSRKGKTDQGLSRYALIYSIEYGITEKEVSNNG